MAPADVIGEAPIAGVDGDHRFRYRRVATLPGPEALAEVVATPGDYVIRPGAGSISGWIQGCRANWRR